MAKGDGLPAFLHSFSLLSVAVSPMLGTPCEETGVHTGEETAEGIGLKAEPGRRVQNK